MSSHICDPMELTDKKLYFDLPVLMVQNYIRLHREGVSKRILETRNEKISEGVSKTSIDPEEQLPDKIYLQIDGGSQNAVFAFASPGDPVGSAGLPRVNEVQHLPEGHTHEGIDVRFSAFNEY